MCKCLSTIGRLLIIVFNLIFAVIGLAFLALGVIVKVRSPVLDSLLQQAQEAFKNAVSGAGFNVDIGNVNVYELVGGLAIAFIALGCFFLLIGLLGVIGACCKVKIVLIMYIILVIIVLLAQIAVVVCVFAFRSVFDSTVKDNLKVVIKTEYTGINGTSAGNLAFNFLMTSQGCCGVDNYTDFSPENAPNWQFRTYTDQNGNTHQLITPMACCKNTSNVPTCAKSPDAMDSTKNNYDKGCYDSLWNIVYSYRDISIGVAAGICGLQLLLIILAITIVYQIDKDKVAAY